MKRKSSTLYPIPSCTAIPFSASLSLASGLHIGGGRSFFSQCILKFILGAKISFTQSTSSVIPNNQKDNVASPHTAVYKENDQNTPRVHCLLLLDDRWMFLQSTNFQTANYPGWRQGFLLAFVRDMKACNSPVRSHNLRFKTSKENCTESGGQRLLLWLTTE